MDLLRDGSKLSVKLPSSREDEDAVRTVNMIDFIFDVTDLKCSREVISIEFACVTTWFGYTPKERANGVDSIISREGERENPRLPESSRITRIIFVRFNLLGTSRSPGIEVGGGSIDSSEEDDEKDELEESELYPDTCGSSIT